MMSEELEQTFFPAKDIKEHSNFSLKEGLKEESRQEEEYAMIEHDSEDSNDVPVSVDEMDRMFDEDFENARENIKNIAEQGTSTLKDMIDLARHSEHPRAFEVVGQLMTKLTEINKDLLSLYGTHTEITEKRKAAKQQKQQPGQNIDSDAKEGSVTNNNTIVFNGSTADLLKYLKTRED